MLFHSKAAQKNQTELVVMITPNILPSELDGRDPEPAAASEPSCRRCRRQVEADAAAGVLHAGSPLERSVPRLPRRSTAKAAAAVPNAKGAAARMTSRRA